MNVSDLLFELEKNGFMIEHSAVESGKMFYISLEQNDNDPLLLDLTEFQTTETGDIFVVGDTPYWFLEEPVGNKTRLASMAANYANLSSIAMSKNTACSGLWFFDISSPWGGPIDKEGAICNFTFVSRIPGKIISVEDCVTLIRISLQTFARSKPPLVRYSEMDEEQITPDDALFSNEQLEDLFIDPRIFEMIKNLKRKAEKEDPLGELARKIKETGLDN